MHKVEVSLSSISLPNNIYWFLKGSKQPCIVYLTLQMVFTFLDNLDGVNF